MSVKDSNTEQLIRDTARRVFFTEGRFQATTQEIADAAGVNRTLVHYYFRSREQLFNLILEDGHAEFHKNMLELIKPELSFKDKISYLIDIWMEHSVRYPYLETYLVSQLRNPTMVERLVQSSKTNSQRLKDFYAEIAAEVKAGSIAPVEPVQFLLNLSAMVNHPMLMRPMLERVLNVSKKEFARIIAERKESILKTLFRK